MKDFLDQANSADLVGLPLNSFVETEYHSSINAAFTRALGRHAGDWRAYRTAKMLESIKTWAAQTNIPLSSMNANDDQRVVVGDTEGHKHKGMSVRDTSIKLIDSITVSHLSNTQINTGN